MMAYLGVPDPLCSFLLFLVSTVWQVGSWFPDQELNPHLLHWKTWSLEHWTIRRVPLPGLLEDIIG